jgi:ADP-ribose pyrophosphatase YjhB (NUDIX family)
LSREYPARPLVGIGIAVLRPGAVLLVRRANPPAQGEWSLPGGAQRLGETAEDAARRELAEETGLAVGPLLLAGHLDSIHRDPDGQVRFHYTILDFCAAYVSGEARAGGDAAELAWAGLDRLDEYRLWDEAVRIVRAGVARLRPD